MLGRAAVCDRRVDRARQRIEPSPFIRCVPDRGDHEQVARAGGGDVEEAAGLEVVGLLVELPDVFVDRVFAGAGGVELTCVNEREDGFAWKVPVPVPPPGH